MPQLVIQRLDKTTTQIDQPETETILVYLDLLERRRILSLMIRTSQGRMLISTHESKLLISFVNAQGSPVRRAEIVSSQFATETALFFLESQGLPAGQNTAVVPAISYMPMHAIGTIAI